ncbi:hypothetical protein ACW5R3_04210 [Bizionia sp. KMM 8389]
MKTLYVFSVFFLIATITQAQYVIQNYSNAEIDQLAIMEEIADNIQNHHLESTMLLLTNPNTIDPVYLDSESTFLSLEYTRKKVKSNVHHTVVDDRNIVWYERNFYKQTKSKLKPRYQIYFTVEFSASSYKIIDLQAAKKKKINTSLYHTN